LKVTNGKLLSSVLWSRRWERRVQYELPGKQRCQLFQWAEESHL